MKTNDINPIVVNRAIDLLRSGTNTEEVVSYVCEKSGLDRDSAFSYIKLLSSEI